MKQEFCRGASIWLVTWSTKMLGAVIGGKDYSTPEAMAEATEIIQAVRDLQEGNFRALKLLFPP